MDFTPISQLQLVFRPNSSLEQCVDISIANDDILEGSEILFVELTTSDPDLILDPAIATVSIMDNDGKLNMLVLI